MKKKILILSLLISGFMHAQVPTDEILHYSFTGGSLTNIVSPGTGDLVQSGNAATYNQLDHYGVSYHNTLKLNGDQFTGGTVNSSNSALTVSLWLKPTSINTNWERIFQIYGASSRGFRLEQKGGNVFGWSGYASNYVGGNNGRSATLTNLYDGNWHHIVIKLFRNGGNYNTYFEVYIDGVKNGNLSNKLVGTGHNLITNGTFIISPSSVANYKKEIDDIKVYSRALSPSEITALYNLCENCYTLTTNTTGNGTVTATPSSNSTYVSGTVVTLTATPDAGSVFSEWSEDVSGNTATTTITINKNTSVTAVFKKLPTFVDANATGNNDGTSWANAYTNLQTAINNTAVTEDIWVARGTYKPTIATIPRKSTFSMNKRQKIYGGFQGNETLLIDRNMSLLYTTNATILSGDLNGNDNTSLVETEASRQENAYHVVTIKGNVTTGGELNGFLITGGNSNGSLYNSCNTGSSSQYDNRTGSAIYANPDNENRQVNMKFLNCTIEKNTGIYYAVMGRFNPCGSQTTESHIDFESCIIKDNYSALSANIGYTGSQQYNIKSYGKIVNSLITGNSTSATNKSSVLLISSGGSSGTTPSVEVSVINTTITKNNSPNNNAITINLNPASSFPIYFYNSIIYNNGGTTSISIGGTGNNGNQATFTNNIVQGGHYSSTNLDPMFVDPANKVFTLQSGSPAIDTGVNSKISTNIIGDLLNNQRIFNTTIDMGAYEFGSPTLGDITPTLNKFDFIIYPNPTNGIINIKSDTHIKTIEIYDLQGKKVKTYVDKKVNISNLNSGIYFLKITTETNLIEIKKIIKR
ncbi:LamG-like jellyroll fold domain-containing protein [Polaribacter sp. Q13]|uniref:InlB B-repeat-containing protein n=1 Tax=Polaribacter sp. Q13 TaxID=2806551 RepID=UPI00193C1E58|nr:LamG-like jellyroll fold domain-containing protein [Polaribacter sp. Q13]QVY67210.1 T9SS type A sorting domain-containing protein [Polaribacter sp. Q13]